MSKANPRFRRTNPPLPAPGLPIYQVIVQGTTEAGMFLCGFGYMGAVAAVPATAEQNIATNFANAVLVAFRACLASTADVLLVKVSCVSVPSRMPYINIGNVNLGLGTAGSTALPSTVAAVLSKYTAYKGQHGRGRNYIPCVPTSFVTAGTNPDSFNVTGANAYNNLLIALDANSISDGVGQVTLCIYTRVARGGAVTNAADVTYTVARPLLGTVRRRRVGRGK